MIDLTTYSFTNKLVFIKGAVDTLPAWDDVIIDLDENVKLRPNEVKDQGNLGIVTHYGENIKSVDIIRKQIHKLRPDESICTAHLYISFLSSSSTTGWHNDDTDVFYIQAKGITNWEVDTGDGEHLFTLSPGDLIYVPKRMLHNTKPITPRVGISIGFTR